MKQESISSLLVRLKKAPKWDYKSLIVQSSKRYADLTLVLKEGYIQLQYSDPRFLGFIKNSKFKKFCYTEGIGCKKESSGMISEGLPCSNPDKLQALVCRYFSSVHNLNGNFPVVLTGINI
ncbi:hypothetical protein [Pleionea mediterranea]|uniref:Uncharacterized protein n=1 Tax=Pleionea mediterranea TaxID=523701 RepID=A0A316FC25_9GAMM|nr:hypothetical protein [Pleionea mediterranea]PWK45333.1 hypothetical protein C8D97_1146 [Pleionea mediterranea]